MDLDQALNEFGVGILTPELTPPEVVSDLAKHPSLQTHALEICRRASVKRVLMAAEVVDLARAHRELGPMKRIDGIGQCTMHVPPRLMGYYCRKWGANWFRDARLKRKFLQLHPELKAETTAPLSLRVNGLKEGILT